MNATPTYQVEPRISVAEFRAVLAASTLGERRPVDEPAVLEAMLAHGNLLVTARVDGHLIGVARSVTDFAYCCYLSDLAVDSSFQRRGVGRELMRVTREQLGPRCTLILLSAPAALEYYPRVGFQRHAGAFVLPPGAPLA